MNFDFTPQFPNTFDIVHLVLAGMTLIMLLTLLFKLLFNSSNNTVSLIGEKGSKKKTSSTFGVAGEQTDEIVTETESPVQTASPDSALQLLSLLQKEARLIDFVFEKINDYSDEEVGAAARVVHEGSVKALGEYFSLVPIRDEAEESRITLAEGFNAAEVRLTGKVVGSAPFTGTLIHRGWRVKEVTLPKISAGHDVAIVAAAEVEL